MAGLVLITGVHDVSGKELQPAFGQRAAVALHAPGGNADSRAAQMRNSTATPLDEVGRGQLADGLVVGPYETGLHSRNRAINQDERHLSPLHVRESLGSRLRRCQDQPVHLSRQQRLGFVSFQFGIFVEIRNDDVITMRPHGFRHRLGNLREKEDG